VVVRGRCDPRTSVDPPYFFSVFGISIFETVMVSPFISPVSMTVWPAWVARTRLLRIPEPFDSPDFVFEPKLDGFRALAHVRGHRCEFVSRNGHTFKQWPQLAEEIAHAARAHSAVLDGEICCLEPDGRTDFKQLLFRREWPFFYAFDVLSIDGEDLTGLSLVRRKHSLLRIMPTVESRLLYLDHIEQRGCDLFRIACERDLEGIVAKWVNGIPNRRTHHELVEGQER
jgi:ATP-dependent DNA ligase